MSIPPLAATPYSAITYEQLENELLAVIRHENITIADVATLFDPAFQALGQAIVAGLFIPVGPPFAVYYGDPMATFDLEIGFPAQSVPTQDIPTAAGTIHASALPAGRAAIVSHIGSYEGLGEAWGTLASNVEGTPSGVWIEAYVSDPTSTPADQMRTDLILRLA